MAHHHHHHHQSSRVLIGSLIVTVLFVVVEVVVGFRAHSLALISDAGHNFSDVFALGLAALGVYFQTRPADHRKTFGYQRAGVLAAFVNALTLVVFAAILLYESWVRLLHPEPVAETAMLWVSAVGLVMNLAIAFGVSGHGHDLNMRAAWLHQLGDAASCVGIIIGALLIRYTGWLAVDPILSILIAILMAASAWGVLRDSLNILLEGLPKGLRLADVTRDLNSVAGVIDVHDLHIWNLGSEARALSCHVLIEDMPPSASDSILRQINGLLCDHFEIHHTTIQFEHVRCALADVSCTATPHKHRH
jgi:cobalt-zinc-cadmium efflux system protein